MLIINVHCLRYIQNIYLVDILQFCRYWKWRRCICDRTQKSNIFDISNRFTYASLHTIKSRKRIRFRYQQLFVSSLQAMLRCSQQRCRYTLRLEYEIQCIKLDAVFRTLDDNTSKLCLATWCRFDFNDFFEVGEFYVCIALHCKKAFKQAIL